MLRGPKRRKVLRRGDRQRRPRHVARDRRGYQRHVWAMTDLREMIKVAMPKPGSTGRVRSRRYKILN